MTSPTTSWHKGTAVVQLHRIYNLQRAETWRFRGDAGNMYQIEHDELFRSIRSGQPINNGDYTVKEHADGIMGRMASYTAREITWQRALKFDRRPGAAALRVGPLAVAAVPRRGSRRFVRRTGWNPRSRAC